MGHLSVQTFICSRSTIETCEICLKLTVKILGTASLTSFWCLIVNLEHVSHLFLVFLLFEFERVNVCWVNSKLVLNN